MDFEKPKPDPPSGSRSDGSARRRADRLTGTGSKERDPSTKRSDRGGDTGPGSDAPSSGGSPPPTPGSPPRLTERQRIEAREKRRSERRGRRERGRASGSKGRADSPTGNPLSRGVRATWLEVRRTAGFIRGLILSGLERLGPALRFLTAGLVALLAAGGAVLARTGRASGAALSRFGTALLALDRIVTPRRTLIAVSAGAVAALVASQFIDFRATEIGQAGYGPILDITGAPRTDVLTPADAHSVLLLLVAGAAIAGVVGTSLTGRRIFAAAIAASGAVTIAVSLLIDLPKGLDVAEAEISYSDVAAVLLSGFWVQLGAGLVLAVGGLGLLVLAGARQRSTADREAGPRRTRGTQGGQRPRSVDAGGVS